MPHLYIIRGLPGSGKSTMANIIREKTYFPSDLQPLHIEADQFFMRNGKYVFRTELIDIAHRWCYAWAVKALLDGHDVIVSNTFTKAAYLAEYFEIPTLLQKSSGLSLLPYVTMSIIEMKTMWGSTHNVDLATLENMAAEWEPIPVMWLEKCGVQVKTIDTPTYYEEPKHD